jgi:outer membrane protein assembly factor BamB
MFFRVRWGVGLGAALFAVAAMAGQASAKATWEDVGYNSGHVGFNATEKIINSRSTAKLANVGSFTSGDQIIYQPAIFGGMIYFRSGDGHLYADDMATKSPVWTLPYSSPATPWGFAVSKAALITNCTTTGSVSGLCAYNPKTGASLWTYALDNGNSYTPPTIDGNIVYFLSGGNEKDDTVDGGHLVSVDLKTGTERWRQWYCDDSPTCESFGGTPAVANGNIYVGCSGTKSYPDIKRTGLCAYKSTGKLIWDKQLGKDSGKHGTDGSGMVAAQGNTVYVVYNTNCNSCNYNIDVAAIDGGTGGTIWDSAIAGPLNGEAHALGAPVVGPDGSTYTAIGAPNGDQRVFALGPNGALLWSIDATINHLYGTPTLAGKTKGTVNGVLFFTCGAQGQGTTCALDASTGSLIWQSTDINVSFNYAPIVTGGAVYNTCGFQNICIYEPQ